MEIDLTEAPANPADATAVLFVADWINTEDGTISGSLFDADGKQVAHKRFYSYKGDRKNIPFADLTDEQINPPVEEAEPVEVE